MKTVTFPAKVVFRSHAETFTVSTIREAINTGKIKVEIINSYFSNNYEPTIIIEVVKD